jgi:hypothetical protein
VRKIKEKQRYLLCSKDNHGRVKIGEETDTEERGNLND